MLNKSILVTGANGFLGQYVLSQLIRSGYTNIFGTYHSHLPNNTLITWRQMDLNDPVSIEKALVGIHTIIHLAAKVSYASKDKKVLDQINYLGTRNLVNASLVTEVKEIIYISSSSTLAKSISPYFISEHELGDPVFYSNYAKSKYKGELEIFRGEAEGLKVCIVHPCLILGVGDWLKGSISIFSKVNRKLSFYPSGTVGLVYAGDVALAIEKILQKKNWMARYLIHAETWTYKKLLSEISNGLDKNPPWIKVNSFVGHIVAKLDTFRSRILGEQAVITSETVVISSFKFEYNNELTNNELGLKYKSLSAIIDSLCRKYVANINDI
ncbi:MAG TPA: NAD-dependent epimerase/dehydratase family protein [Saprospiraceae bacterium]|nr:NAD-dependent epimerase/dehydratase family protein [Saprospiraceae bacterium]